MRDWLDLFEALGFEKRGAQWRRGGDLAHTTTAFLQRETERLGLSVNVRHGLWLHRNEPWECTLRKSAAEMWIGAAGTLERAWIGALRGAANGCHN